jgi:tRNA-specific 2-thiouridylase
VTRVLALFSGSLASRVAARWVSRCRGVESVHLLHFRSPFAAETEDLRLLVRDEWPRSVFRTQSLKREYRKFLEPDGDSFSAKRACQNCRSLLLSRGVRYMTRIGAEYIVTGDMLGRNGLGAPELMELDEQAGVSRRVLRPLCFDYESDAPSVEAWADLNAVARSASRSGDRIGELAASLGIDPRDPLGCAERCKLMIPGFGERVSNLFDEQGFTLNALRLLDFVLYYKLPPDTKVVIATTEEEKHELQNLFLPQDLRVYPSTPYGPMTLVRADWERKSVMEQQEIIVLAARITATHACVGRSATIPIYYRFECDDETMLINAFPFPSIREIAEAPGIEALHLFDREPLLA